MGLFKKKVQQSTVQARTVTMSEKDWFSALTGNGCSFYEYLIGQNQTDLSKRLLFCYYQKASPVADAIDRIAKEFASIEPKIYDKKNAEFVDTPFLQVLENPNLMMSKHQFLYNIAVNYSVSGDLFVYGTGISKLQELNYIEPFYLTLYSNSLNQLERIAVNKEFYTQDYTMKEINGESFYIAKNQLGRFVRAYSPYYSYGNQWGLSRLSAVSFEIEQFIFSSIHNLALLNNTVKPSLIVSPDSDMGITEDEYDRLQAQVESFLAGSTNAGKTLLMNQKMSTSVLNNKVDSDFQVLRKNVETAIYRRLDIPLALVTDSAMTFNNLEVANLMLYDNAVLPLAKLLYKQLQDIIFYYGKIDSEQYEITYDPNDIEALALRKSQLIDQKRNTGAYTFNELRQMYGDERLASGGDDIYVQSTQIPVAENIYVEPDNGNAQEPENQNS